MEFLWDENKREKNLAKHGLDFVDADGVFANELSIAMYDPRYTDNRWVLLGPLRDPESEEELIVHIAYQECDTHSRIISMRPATKRERDDYRHNIEEAGLQDACLAEFLQLINDDRQFEEDLERMQKKKKEQQ